MISCDSCSAKACVPMIEDKYLDDGTDYYTRVLCELLTILCWKQFTDNASIKSCSRICNYDRKKNVSVAS